MPKKTAALSTDRVALPPEGERRHRARVSMFEALHGEGWSLYLLTFMFEQMPGGPIAVRHQQARGVEGVYAHFVTRVVRRPCAPSWRGRLPAWLCCPDFPVPRHLRGPLADAVVNDGQHVHGVGTLPPWSRHVADMAAHFRDERARYAAIGGLARVRADLITHDLDRVCGYAHKALARRRVGEDSVIVLPRTIGELRDGGTPVGRNSSNFG